MKTEGEALVDRVFRIFIAKLRAILARREPEMRRQFPNQKARCATCAFNPATDRMQGFDTTCDNLRQAIDHGKPFYCHDAMPIVDGEYQPPKTMLEMTFCRGFADIAEDPETKTAFERAAIEGMDRR